MRPDRNDLKAQFAKQRETEEYKEDFNRLFEMEFADFMQEFIEFYNRISLEMLDELESDEPTVEEREWFFLYYGGELYFDVIKAHQWGEKVDMALALIEQENQ